MKNQLITADDFGLNSKTIKETIRLAKMKKVSNVSLLTTTNFSKEAVRLYKKNSLTKLGLHFNLIEGQPLTQTDKVRSLVDKKGRFFPLPVFLFKLFLRKINDNDIRTELKSQLNFLKNYYPVCHHIDSHQNTHLFYPVNKIVDEEAKKANIKHVRQSDVIEKRLQKFPLKLFLYKIIIWLFNVKFGKARLSGKTVYETSVCHPGTNYD